VNGLFAAGLILLAAAAAIGFISPRARWMRSAPYLTGAAGAACLAAVGGFALAGRTVQLHVAGWLGQPAGAGPAPGLAADRLSGMFLAVAFGAAVPVSVAFGSWAAKPQAPASRMLAEGYALALGATAVIMTAQDAFTALFGWEALTAAFYLLAGASQKEPDRVGAARITVAFGKVSGAALLAGLLLLACCAAGDGGVVRRAAVRAEPDGLPRGPGALHRAAGRGRHRGCAGRRVDVEPGTFPWAGPGPGRGEGVGAEPVPGLPGAAGRARDRGQYRARSRVPHPGLRRCPPGRACRDGRDGPRTQDRHPADEPAQARSVVAGCTPVVHLLFTSRWGCCRLVCLACTVCRACVRWNGYIAPGRGVVVAQPGSGDLISALDEAPLGRDSRFKAIRDLADVPVHLTAEIRPLL
jgi:hypothetical protein